MRQLEFIQDIFFAIPNRDFAHARNNLLCSKIGWGKLHHRYNNWRGDFVREKSAIAYIKDVVIAIQRMLGLHSE